MKKKVSVFIVAGEQSGDQLGFRLIQALRRQTRGNLAVRGVGGQRMESEGLKSLFPIEDIAVMGFADVLRRLPLLRRRIRETAAAVLADPPDVVVIIDSPDFTHRVARLVREQAPSIPIVDYVSPSVWAWRPERASRMTVYVDHVLALLPFEPAAHRKLGGPECTYVGHPLTERIGEFRPAKGERTAIGKAVDLLVLPGSRRSVVRRHMPLFGDVLRRLNLSGALSVTIPAIAGLENEIGRLSETWPVAPKIVEGEPKKLEAMRKANAALAVSGTGTLELALSGVPMVGVYRIEPLAGIVRRFVTIAAPHILLPNLILGKRAIPEFAAEAATPEDIVKALRPLLTNSAKRKGQLNELAKLDAKMKVPEPPSALAAKIVLSYARSGRR